MKSAKNVYSICTNLTLNIKNVGIIITLNEAKNYQVTLLEGRFFLPPPVPEYGTDARRVRSQTAPGSGTSEAV